MLVGKQVDRLVAKVMRLTEVYRPFLIQETILPQVFLQGGGGQRPMHSGDRWGGEFEIGRFAFRAEGIEPDKKYRLFADTGAVEHLVAVNGYSVGILDHVDHAMEPMFRIHRYLWLEGLQTGDEVSLEGYYSHTFPGTMPYAEKSTFALDGHYPYRPYEQVGLAVFDEDVYAFTEKLELLNAWYRKQPAGSYAAAAAERLYTALFKILPIRQVKPDKEVLLQAGAMIDSFLTTPEDKPYVGIIGHSHLDTAWLWPVAETRRKLHRTVSNAITLLKRHPEYKFFLSTVLYLQWIEEDDPALFAQVGEMIRQGRIEPNGATWVECDGNLTGAEALCRQFLRGKRYLREKFGYESDTFWLPDTFGYSAALPQILQQCGVKYFLTTKLSWNDTNYFPYESFLWRGIDGSKVPVHFNSIQTWIDEESVHKRLQDIRDKRESDCVLMAYGFGDGGGGPSEEMVSRAVYTAARCREATVEHTGVSDFMKKLAAKELPEYSGELYLELHRGTYTSIHELKQNNRRLEEALHDAELVSIFAGEDVSEKTDALYDTLLLNQFHDILPGTCIAQAHEEAIAQQKQAISEAKALIDGDGEKKWYFNTLAFPRRELLEDADGACYTDLNGQERRLSLYGFDAFGYGKKLPAQGSIQFDGKHIRTPLLSATVEAGVLTSLVFGGREYVQGSFGRICWAENMPYIYDNWDIDADYVLKQQPARFLSQQTVLQTPSLLILRVVFAFAERSKLITDIIFRADSPLVSFENRLEADDDSLVLKACFDTSLFAKHYHCETQFGCLERNCYPAEKPDLSRFEVCAHKWTDISEKKAGLSLVSDVKYGVSCIGNVLGLTLHKSGTHPDGRGDRGVHCFRYGLLPHAGDLSEETVRQAYAFNLQPVITARQNMEAPFCLKNEGSVVLETVKRGVNGGLVLRLYESLGASDTVTIRTEAETAFCLCNILEDEVETLPAGREITLSFKPFEIKTLLLK